MWPSMADNPATIMQALSDMALNCYALLPCNFHEIVSSNASHPQQLPEVLTQKLGERVRIAILIGLKEQRSVICYEHLV